MWIIELNIAGQRFSGQISDLPRKPLRSLRLGPRTVQWRVPQARHPHAA